MIFWLIGVGATDIMHQVRRSETFEIAGSTTGPNR